MIAVVLMAVAALIAFVAACVAASKMIDVADRTESVTTQALCVLGTMVCAFVCASTFVLIIGSPIMFALEAGWI